MTDARPAVPQAVIRQWARERNLAIGSRGRLPRSIVEAFQRETATSAGNADHPSDSAQPADSGFGPLEPLARYLEPRFGNIYGWDNTIVPYAPDGFFQPWTDELRQAVRHYLLHEAPEPLLKAAFPHRQPAHPADWAEDELGGYQPWEIALRFHEAAVILLPTLDALIGQLQTWPYEDDREDAADWLAQHATEAQLRQLATAGGQADLAQWDHRGNVAFDLAQRLDPPTLLKAWHDLTDSAPSDLANTEWDLISLLLPAPAGYDFYNRTRAAINGMLYQYQEQCPWSQVPIRYGRGQRIYFRRRNYQRTGVFKRMLEGLEGKSEAARIVSWLRHEVGTTPASAGNGTITT